MKLEVKSTVGLGVMKIHITFTKCHYLLSQKIDLWNAIFRRRIFGLLFFEETVVMGVVCRDLINHFIALLEVGERDCWFQQDDATTC